MFPRLLHSGITAINFLSRNHYHTTVMVTTSSVAQHEEMYRNNLKSLTSLITGSFSRLRPSGDYIYH